MKRQKRNLVERAFSKGYQAGYNGRSRSLCPHISGSTRQQWLSGWSEGRVDNWDGYNQAAQAQKVSNFNH